MPEPWLRGTRIDVPAVVRGVMHALELAQEDIAQGCGSLSDDEVNSRPAGLASITFHVRHIAGSIDRLLTYAEERELTREQLETLANEEEPAKSKEFLIQQLAGAIALADSRIRQLASVDLEQPRSVEG